MNQLTQPAPHSRREFLWEAGGGLGGVALAALLNGDGLLAGESATLKSPLAGKPAHFAARASSVIQIFCPGGLSHVDTWDYKPELERQHGKPFEIGRAHV